MHENDQSIDIFQNEINLAKILEFLVKNWKLILGFGLIGIFSSIGYLSVTPSQYEATAILEMARIPTSNVNNPGNPVETPALLLERLKKPSTFTSQVIRTCNLDSTDLPGEMLIKMMKVSLPKNLNSVVDISVRRGSPDLAKQCMSAVVEMIRDQQQLLVKSYRDELNATFDGLQLRLRKINKDVEMEGKAGLLQSIYLARRDESIYLIQQIDELQRTLSRSSQTRLVTPVYVGLSPVFPKWGITLVVGVIAGLVLGVLFAYGRKLIKR